MDRLYYFWYYGWTFVQKTFWMYYNTSGCINVQKPKKNDHFPLKVCF